MCLTFLTMRNSSLKTYKIGVLSSKTSKSIINKPLCLFCFIKQILSNKSYFGRSSKKRKKESEKHPKPPSYKLDKYLIHPSIMSLFT